MKAPLEVSIRCIGYDIKADWYDTETNQVLLILPGYPSTKKKYELFAKELQERTDYSILVIDYAGLGESPLELDDLTRADNFTNVIAAYDWLVENYPDKKITVVGTSYGGFMATYLVNFRNVDRAVLRVPAYYTKATMYTKHAVYNRDQGREYRKELENVEDKWFFPTKNLPNRVLVITHEYDDVCPPVSTQPFIDAFKADHWEAPGFKHGFGESDVSEEQKQQYYQKIADWIKG